MKILIFAAVLGVALFAATYSLQFIATTIYSVIMAMVIVRRKEHLSIWLTCFVILMYVLIFTIPPLYLHSASVARYKLQRGYIGLYNNVKEPSGLPKAFCSSDNSREEAFNSFSIFSCLAP